jgi:diguanylate cyclase (GGDEF)-like protein
MEAAGDATYELRRQAALYALALLDTEPEEEFERVARLAQRLLGVPSAIVSFMDHDRQWYKARVGVEATEAPRPLTFCRFVIDGGGSLVIPDATADPRVRDNPHVTAEGGIRFYAGVPIHSPDGYRIGTLCAFDTEVREMEDGDLQALIDLAAMVDEMIHARQQATIDELTGVQNRRGFARSAAQLFALADRVDLTMILGFADLDGLKPINDQLGHDAGDQAIAAAADVLNSSFREADIVARMGGDEFALLFTATDGSGAAAALARLDDGIAQRNATKSLPFELSMSAGFLERAPGGADLEQLLDAADALMYERKRSRPDRR